MSRVGSASRKLSALVRRLRLERLEDRVAPSDLLALLAGGGALVGSLADESNAAEPLDEAVSGRDAPAAEEAPLASASLDLSALSEDASDDDARRIEQVGEDAPTSEDALNDPHPPIDVAARDSLFSRLNPELGDEFFLTPPDFDALTAPPLALIDAEAPSAGVAVGEAADLPPAVEDGAGQAAPAAEPAFLLAAMEGLEGLDGFDEGSMLMMMGQSTITVSASGGGVMEGSTDPTKFTFFRSGGMTSMSLMVNYSASGTATAIADYSSPMGLAGVVQFLPYQLQASVALAARRDNLVEAAETVVVTVTPGTMYVVGAPSVATGTILDDPAIVSISAPDAAAAEENNDPGTFRFSREGGDIAQALDVRFGVGGTATFLDYSPTPHLIGSNQYQIWIPATYSYVDFTITPVDDALVEVEEPVIYTVVAHPQNTYLIGAAEAQVVIADNEPRVTLIDFLDITAPGYGDLEKGTNPDGGTRPAFMGGDRFFPDAFDTNDKDENEVYRPHNFVRVVAQVANAEIGDIVYFRTFDVDDPSTDAIVDPDDIGGVPHGRDNRGTLIGFDRPGPSATPPVWIGYEGNLRPFFASGPGLFGGPQIAVPVRAASFGLGAEVDLATTYAPGDNFRVVASFDEAKTTGLNGTDDVPTAGTGTAKLQEFIATGGAVTPQLSVWRKFRIEQDYMAGEMFDETVVPPDPPISLGPPGDKAVGLIAHNFEDQPGVYLVATNIANVQADSYEGGTLRAGGQVYAITGNTAGPNAVFIVSASAPLANGDVEVFQDDWNVTAESAAPWRSPPNGAKWYDMLQPTTVRAENRFADAYLQPDLETLNNWDTTNQNAVTHVSDIVGRFNPHRGTEAGAKMPPQPAYTEAELFWAVYFSTAFEHHVDRDNDPLIETAAFGATDRDIWQISVGYVETIRDAAAAAAGTNPDPANPGTLTPLEIEYRRHTTVHEIGHQFLRDDDFPDQDGVHRSSPPDTANLMQPNTGVDDVDFYFHPEEINKLRKRVASP